VPLLFAALAILHKKHVLLATLYLDDAVRVPQYVARVVTRLVAWLIVDYFTYATRLGALARHAAPLRLLRLHHVFGYLSISCGSSRSSARRSSSTTSPTPRVREPRHAARLITRLVVDYSASRRLVVDYFFSPLVVDYFAYAARPGASARHAARRQLLRLHSASGCLVISRGSSRGLSRGSSSTTSLTPRVRESRLVTWLVVNYFGYTARSGASVRRAAHHVARRQLLRLRHASGCLGTSRGSSRGSSRHSSLKDRLGDQRGGECMGADKNSSRGRLKLRQDKLARSNPRNHTLRTSTFRFPKPRCHWSAIGPRNKLYQQPQHTRSNDSVNNSKVG
jgi:hypothetical protein